MKEFLIKIPDAFRKLLNCLGLCFLNYKVKVCSIKLDCIY